MTRRRGKKPPRSIGNVARAGEHTVRTFQVGAVPLLADIFKRMNLW